MWQQSFVNNMSLPGAYEKPSRCISRFSSASGKIWTILATREAFLGACYSGRGAKMRTPHIVPLSRQVAVILK